MVKPYATLILLAFAGPATAQYTAGSSTSEPAPAALAVRLPPTSFRSGTYQLLSGGWQRGKLLYDESSLSVTDATHSPRYPRVIAADSVREFVLGRDTFQLVRHLDLPQVGEHRRATFARRLYRRGGFEVSELVAVRPAPAPPAVYTLLARPGQPTPAVLPPGRVQFRLALAKALADYRALSQQLELDSDILPE